MLRIFIYNFGRDRNVRQLRNEINRHRRPKSIAPMRRRYHDCAFTDIYATYTAYLNMHNSPYERRG